MGKTTVYTVCTTMNSGGNTMFLKKFKIFSTTPTLPSSLFHTHTVYRNMAYLLTFLTLSTYSST